MRCPACKENSFRITNKSHIVEGEMYLVHECSGCAYRVGLLASPAEDIITQVESRAILDITGQRHLAFDTTSDWWVALKAKYGVSEVAVVLEQDSNLKELQDELDALGG